MEQYFAYANEGNGKKAYPWLINMQHPVANVMKHVYAFFPLPSFA